MKKRVKKQRQKSALLVEFRAMQKPKPKEWFVMTVRTVLLAAAGAACISLVDFGFTQLVAQILKFV